MRCLIPLALTILPTLAPACELALVLAVDVSGSVDPQEYGVQMQGLALALNDDVVASALVDQRAQLKLFQWLGSSRQVQSLPWTQMSSYADVAAFSQAITDAPRRWRNFSTALGEAVQVSAASFDAVPECYRRVIDVSGDGISNEGIVPIKMRNLLTQQGIVVNALAIETDDADLTGYFYENLIWGEGAFVITANGFVDYPAQIRRKLQRETTKQLSRLPQEPDDKAIFVITQKTSVITKAE